MSDTHTGHTVLLERAFWFLAAAAAAAIVVNLGLGQGLHGALYPLLAILAITAPASALRARFARQAAEERANTGAAAEKTSRLFEDSDELDGALLSPERSLGHFDRFAGWIAAPAQALILAAGAVVAVLRLRAGLAPPPETIPWFIVMALGAEAFVFFVVGRVFLSWHRNLSAPGLRLAGQFAGCACVACLACAAVLVLPATLRPAAAVGVEWALVAVFALAAFESALRSLGALYRTAASTRAPIWDENLVAAFFAEPASWWRRLCESLDYQFGFEVSRTWAFRLLAGALPPFALVVGLILYLASAVAFIAPEEAGVVERFGMPAPEGSVLGPGLHLIRPWPFGTLRRFPVRRIQSFTVGVRLEPGEEEPRVILWDVPHYRQEDYMLVAGRREPGLEEAGSAVPANLLVVNIPVEFVVTNLHQYLYNHAAPAGLLERLAARAITLQAAGRDLFGFFGQGQLATALDLRKMIQAEADALRLGVGIRFVGLQGVHPPVSVAPAFQQVVGAVEQKEAAIWKAQGYVRRLLPLAQANADALDQAAKAEAHRRATLAEAEAILFEARLKGEAAAPAVFRARLFLDSLVQGLARSRKILVAVEPEREVISLNLESRLSRDLFEFALGTNSPSGETKP